MALGDVIARLSVHLGLETAAFEKGSKRAENRMSGFQKNMQRTSNAVKAAFVGMLGVFAVDQIVSVAKAGLEYASSLGEVASQLGVTTKALQQYRFAATQAGIEQGEMDKGLSKLSIQIGQAANGSAKAVKLFEKLGISIRDANGNVKDAGDVFPEIAEAYKNLGSAAERSALSAEVFGAKMGPKFNALLEGGAAGVNNLRDAAQKLGVVLSDEQIQKADETADKLAAMKQVLEARIAGVVADNADSILALVDALSKLVTAAGDAAKAWRYFTGLDFSWNAPSLSKQLQAMQVRDLGPGVELTESVKKAVAARRSAPFAGPSGGPLRSAPKRAPAPRGMTPWGPTVQPGLSRAVGGSAFGGGFGSFDPGQGASGWMRIAQAANDTAKPVAAIDTMMTRIAMQTGVRMVANFREAAADSDQIARSAQNIIDRLFPDEARTRQYADDLAILKLQYGGAAENAAKLAEAEKRLRNEWVMSTPAVEALSKGFGKYVQVANDATEASEATTVRIAKSFNDMAQDVLGSLNQLSNSIRGGGFLDILTAVVGLGLQLGGAGVFGKKIQTNINRVPAYANGTSFARGGLSLVGERGPELVNLPRGSSVTPNNELGSIGGVATIVPSPYFDVVVDGRVMRAAPGIASAGASGGLAQMRRSGQRRVA